MTFAVYAICKEREKQYVYNYYKYESMPAKHVWLKTIILKMVLAAILDLALWRQLPDFLE